MGIRHKKTRIVALAVALLTLSCTFTGCNNTEEEIVASHANGTPKLVMTTQKSHNDTKMRIGETAYYEDGQVMYEKHFKDDKPTGEWKFYYADGTLFATGNFSEDHDRGKGWKFYDNTGKDLYGEEPYDSVIVLQNSGDYRPQSIAYCIGNDQLRFRFNENYTVNARGWIRNGKKEGKWTFYYATGQLQMEAIYHNDKEDGAYNSYRENGLPYFRGFYINGRRAHIWEIYDEQGNLQERKDFDTH